MARSDASSSDEDDGDQLTLASSLSAPESTGWSIAADQSTASSATSLGGGGEDSSAASSRGAYALPNVYHRANRANVGDAGTIASGGSAGTARSGSRMLQQRARQQQHARASVVTTTTTTTTTAETPTNPPHPESGSSISSDDSSTIKSIASSNLSYSSSNKHAAPSPYALPNVYNTRRIAHDEDAASGAGSAGTARSGRRLIQQQQQQQERSEHTVAVEETETKKQKSEPPSSATSPSALPTRDTASEAGTSGDADGSGDGTTGTGMSGASGRVGIVPRRSDNTAERKTEIGDEDESSVATPDPPYIDVEMLDREHARILNKKSWSGMKWKEMVVEPPAFSSGEDSSLPPPFSPVISGGVGVPAVVSYSGADVAEAMERGTNMANDAEPSLSGGKTVGDGSTITSNYYAPFFHYHDGKIANEAEKRDNRRAAATRRPKWFMLTVILLLIMVLAAATGATLCGLGYCKSTHSSKSQASAEGDIEPSENGADAPTPPPDTAPQPTPPAPDSDAAWPSSQAPVSSPPNTENNGRTPPPAPSPLVPGSDATLAPTAAPIMTIPLAGETASPTAAPETTRTLPASPAPSPSPTEPPVEPPTEPPVTSPPATAGPAFVVTSTDELRSAVDDYLAGILTVPINDWDVSLVSDFSELFSADRNPATVDFNEDLDRWDVSNAVTFMGLFRKAASFNGNIATWNTAKVTNMEEAFDRAVSFNGDISGWQTGSVTNFYRMFQTAASFNSPIGDWETGNALVFAMMFINCAQFNQELPWDTGKAVNMNGMFQSAPSFNQDLDWDTRRVTDMSEMFRAATSFDGDLSSFDTSKVTTMEAMFRDAASYSGKGLEAFDTSKVVSMERMFFGASSLQGSGMADWNIRKVENMDNMFAGSTLMQADLCSWRDQLPAADRLSAKRVFAGTSCPRKDGPDLDDLSTSSFCHSCEGSFPLPATLPPADVSEGFSGEAFFSTTELRDAVDAYMADSSSTSEYGHPIGNWDVSGVSDFSQLFSAKRNPQMLYFDEDLSHWNMESATNCDSMFEETVSFTNSGNSLAGWDMSKVTSMSRMFASSAFQGDISQWSVRRVRDFSFMFEFATDFASDLSGWQTNEAVDFGWMFRGAMRFNSSLSGFDVWGVSSFVLMFAGASSFDQNLCSWDVQPRNADTRGIFAATSCPSTQSPPGSWCHSCGSAGSHNNGRPGS